MRFLQLLDLVVTPILGFVSKVARFLRYWAKTSLRYGAATPQTILGFLFVLAWARRWPRHWKIQKGAVTAILPREHVFGRPGGGQAHGWFILYVSEDARNDLYSSTHEHRHVLQALRYGPIYPAGYAAHFSWLFAASVRTNWRAFADLWRLKERRAAWKEIWGPAYRGVCFEVEADRCGWEAVRRHEQMLKFRIMRDSDRTEG